MTDSQLSAWEEVVAAAKRDAANHRMALRSPRLAPHERTIGRRKLARCEAIMAMDVMYHHLRQIEEAPDAFEEELDDLLR